MTMLRILYAILFDQVIKNEIEENPSLHKRVNPNLRLRTDYVKTPGMAMGLLSKKKESVLLIRGIAILFLLMLRIKRRKKQRFFLDLILAGAISNLADLLKRGYVVDHWNINMGPLKNIYFNLADAYIVLGALGESVRKRTSGDPV